LGAWQDALSYFEQAVASDPSYELPRIVSAIVHWNLGELSKADAITVRVDQDGEGLGRFEHAVLEMIRARFCNFRSLKKPGGSGPPPSAPPRPLAIRATSP